MRPLRAALLAALAVVLLPGDADAQIRASEPASFTQTIDGTTIRIDYYRPRTRGRSPLFGPEAVVWEHVWTPGANWATKIAFQKPIELDGVKIEPGIYSLWMEMDENMMPREFFFEPDTLIFHTVGPKREDDQIRFPVTMEDDAPFTEVLRWDFEDISSTGGTLALRWGTHRFSWEVKVEPSLRQTTTGEEAAPVVGEYEMHLIAPTGEATPSFSLTLFRDDEDVLHADWEGVPELPDGSHEFFNSLDMWLLPGGAEGWFIPGESYEPGVLMETWAGYFVEFTIEDGSATSFLMRDDLDNVMARGTRVN